MPLKHICSAGVILSHASLVDVDACALAVFGGCPHHQGVARDGYALAEIVSALPLGRVEVGLLRPGGSFAHKHIDAAYFAHHERVAREGYASAEQLTAIYRYRRLNVGLLKLRAAHAKSQLAGVIALCVWPKRIIASRVAFPLGTGHARLFLHKIVGWAGLTNTICPRRIITGRVTAALGAGHASVFLHKMVG